MSGYSHTSLPTKGGGSGGSTIARSAAMHLAGMSRVNLVNYSTFLHKLARVVALPVHSGNWDNNESNGSGL
jgi:hypothetical protein